MLYIFAMGTLIYQDMLARYNGVEDKYISIEFKYDSLDARALSRLGDVLYEAQVLQEDLKPNVSRKVTTPMPGDEMAKLRNDADILVESIDRSISTRVGLIRNVIDSSGR